LFSVINHSVTAVSALLSYLHLIFVGEDFASALETVNNKWGSNSPDIIIVDVGYLLRIL